MVKTKMLQMVLDRVVTIDKKVDDVKKEVVKNGKRIDKLDMNWLSFKMMHRQWRSLKN